MQVRPRHFPLALLPWALAAAGPGDPALLTVAERSGYEATSTHAEVVELLQRLAAQSGVLHLAEMGRSVEGRALPLAVLADPPVETPEEARAGGKAVVFAFGNIHAGEVCGKEALLMLARELALEPRHPLLGDLVIMLAPIYNADGNDRMSPDNRPGQDGPVRGMGERRNAQGLDLNRDCVKLESPEARAMARLLREWDPHLIVDSHTTNGSRHRYILTYDAPLNPSGHPGPIGFVRERLLPEVSRRLEARCGYRTFFYGNFDREHTTWETYSALPRFGGSYHGLRGHMSILAEAYSYAPFRDRVLATLEFVREILRYAAEHRTEILAVVDRARRETIEAGREPQPHDTVGLRHRVAPFPEPAVVLGYEPESDRPRDHTVVHLGRFEPVLGVRRPHAYLLEPGLGAVVENLRAHGIGVEPFEGTALVETYTVTRIDRAEDPFEGHHLIALEVRASPGARHFPAGSFLVRTAQPLGTLAVYLLEPESEDGLAAWNFLDERLAAGGACPVHRVRCASDLPEEARSVTRTVPPASPAPGTASPS